MGVISELAIPEPPEREPKPLDLPKGWEPGIRWSNASDSGTIVTDVLASEPDAALWAELIADWGLDPQTLEVVDGSIELIGWDSPVKGTQTGEKVRLKRYKARLRRRTHVDDTCDIEALQKAAQRRKPRKTNTTDAERALVVALSDWQVGKGEGGGTPAMVERITSAFDGVERKLAELKRLGRPVSIVYVVGLGDIVEQCYGHYPSQSFTTDLNRREQMRVARRLVLNLVDRLVDKGHRVVVSAVAGNHGENREGGKAITTPDDSDDLAVFEQVGEVLSANPDRYGDVSLYLPTALSMTLDVCGVPIGFTHGHIANGGGNVPAKIEKWWTGQVMGFQPVADARILVTGHYHHLLVIESTGRTHIQCPAMDGGSGWWTQSTGQHSPAGMLTFVAGADCGPRGWSELEVL